jgi:hypothetical protein
MSPRQVGDASRLMGGRSVADRRRLLLLLDRDAEHFPKRVSGRRNTATAVDVIEKLANRRVRIASADVASKFLGALAGLLVLLAVAHNTVPSRPGPSPSRRVIGSHRQFRVKGVLLAEAPDACAEALRQPIGVHVRSPSTARCDRSGARVRCHPTPVATHVATARRDEEGLPRWVAGPAFVAVVSRVPLNVLPLNADACRGKINGRGDAR